LPGIAGFPIGGKGLKIKLLPSTAGWESQFQSLTSFLIDDRLAIDCGSLGFALAPDQIGAIRHIVVTHAHSDHTASLPIYVAEAFTTLDDSINVYASAEVVSALRQFVFNDQIWPDFEKIPLANDKGPTMRFQIIEMRKPVNIAGFKITPIPVSHTVPTVGLVVEDERAAVIFTSDTYSTDEIWEAARKVERLKAVFVDVSYPDELAELAAASKHLTPGLLASELKKLDRDVEIYAVHIKPSNRDEVVRQIAMLKNELVSVGEINRVYEW
jgi:ribonuclease BN (tRNA processing enzyme)